MVSESLDETSSFCCKSLENKVKEQRKRDSRAGGKYLMGGRRERVKNRKLKAREEKAKERSISVNRDTYLNGEGKEGERDRGQRELGMSKGKKVFITRMSARRNGPFLISDFFVDYNISDNYVCPQPQMS
jgi:hypothetical protein